MRTLLIGVLAATLVGCSYPLSPQASMEACTDPNGFGGLNKTAASRPIEPAPASSKTNSATTRVKSAIAAKTEERSTAAVRDRPQLAEKKPTSTVIEAKVEAPASSRPAETSDPVLVKAKTTIAAKLEDPASAEFGEMKRAMRKNTFGKVRRHHLRPCQTKEAVGRRCRRLAVSVSRERKMSIRRQWPREFGGGERVSQYLQLAWNDRTAARICCNGPEGPPTTFLRTSSKVGSNVAISSNSLQSVWGRACSMENGNQNWWSD